jgi:hypothetical protein
MTSPHVVIDVVILDWMVVKKIALTGSTKQVPGGNG